MVVAVTEPALFVAVSVYVVVAVGLTETEFPLTVPTDGLIFKLVAPLTLHDSVLKAPAAMEAGEALKLLIVGGAGLLLA